MTHAVNSINGFSSVIHLSDFRIKLNLGVPENERSNKQEVSISFKFFYKTPPHGFISDDINDTICYFKISQLIEKYCADKEFKLLEYMCNGLYKQIREVTPVEVKIWLKIEKWPVIENLRGATAFEYSDIWE